MKLLDKWLEEDLQILAGDNAIPWERFWGKTVFITGATGLIGSLAVKALIYSALENSKQIKIVCLVRNEEKAKNLYKEFLNLIQGTDVELCFVVGELEGSLEGISDIDFIIHAASPTSSKFFVTKPVETIEAIVGGTENVLKLATKNQVEGMVFVSSMEVYGTVEGENVITTEDGLGYINNMAVRSCYSEGKRMAECLCAAFAEEYDVKVCVARLAQTFGAGVLDTESRVFFQMAKSAINGEDIVLRTTGESEGNYCYSRDAIKGILMLLSSGIKGEAYTIVNEETHTTIKDMAYMVAEKIAGGKIKVRFDLGEDGKKLGYAPNVKLRLSAGKIKSLGWEPQVGLEEAYERLIGSIGAGNNA